MSYFIRMIAKQKWEKISEMDLSSIPDDVPSDFFTSEFRTQNNTLSVWKVEELSDESICKVAKALASSRDKIDRLDLIFLDEERLRRNCIQLEHSPEAADTPFEELKEHHYDLVNLNYNSIGNIISCALEIYQADSENSRRITRSDVKRLLQDAITNNEIKKEKLKTTLQKDL